MADESFGEFATALDAAKLIHFVVEVVKVFGVLAGMRETRGALAALGLRDIDVVRGMKMLGLKTLVHLEIIEIEFLSAFHPSVVNQQRDDPMVAMRVDGPVGEDDVGMLCLQNLAKVSVTRAVDFGVAVNLSGKYRARFQNRAGFLGFRGPNGRGLLRGLARDSGFSAGQVEQDRFMSQIGVQSRGASASAFRIVRMRAGDNDFELARGVGFSAPALAKPARRALGQQRQANA